MPKLTKAVIPAAGLGTRFLPATKAIPKEMLPVVDRPVIQYVVEEAASAGFADVLMVTGRNKTPLENHFDRVAELETNLERAGKIDQLEAVRHASNIVDIHYTRQGDPKGLGHAVHRGKKHVGDEGFAVLLGDDIIDGGDHLLATMEEIYHRTGASVIAVQEVPEDKVSSYGIITPGEAIPTTSPEDQASWIHDMVEKPQPEDAPSRLAAIGRYVLRPEVFDVLENLEPGRAGEIQLTDALMMMAKDPETYGGVAAVVHGGRRFDTGNKLDFIKTNLEIGLSRPDIGDNLRQWLKTLDI